MKTVFKLLFGILVSCVCSNCNTLNDTKTDSLVQQFEKAYKAGEWKKALDLLNSLRRKGIKGNVLPIEAECYAGLGEYEKAISMLVDELKIDTMKNIYYVHETLANIYYLKGDNEKAISAYNRAIELNPSYATPYIKLANIYQQQQNIDKAIYYYLSVIELFTDHRFFDEVIEYSNKVLCLDSVNISAWKSLFYATYSKKEYDKALAIGFKTDEVLEQAQQWEDRHVNWLFIGMSAYYYGDYQLSYELLCNSIQYENVLKEYGLLCCCYLSATCTKLNKNAMAEEFMIAAKELFDDKLADSLIKQLLNYNKSNVD